MCFVEFFLPENQKSKANWIFKSQVDTEYLTKNPLESSVTIIVSGV